MSLDRERFDTRAAADYVNSEIARYSPSDAALRSFVQYMSIGLNSDHVCACGHPKGIHKNNACLVSPHICRCKKQTDFMFTSHARFFFLDRQLGFSGHPLVQGIKRLQEGQFLIHGSVMCVKHPSKTGMPIPMINGGTIARNVAPTSTIFLCEWCYEKRTKHYRSAGGFKGRWH